MEHKDAPQHRVVHERPGDHKFVFGGHLADVGHVLFLKLFTRLFAQLRSVGGTIQQYEEVLGGGVRLGLGLRESRAHNHEEAEQKHIVREFFSYAKNSIHSDHRQPESNCDYSVSTSLRRLFAFLRVNE